ncbi:hypothetical protein DFQ30_000450 [Apophysomyces sp. BC1015]|nr:hypothetical protein DFQ30_000450 [Apophysomyces sp. BC1015]KAG0178089.1 hypothetical protein DFQ29_003967 [Apophysomyces sp. BC1021]
MENELEFLGTLLDRSVIPTATDRQYASLYQAILERRKKVVRRRRDRLSFVPVEILLDIVYWLALSAPETLAAVGQVSQHFHHVMSQHGMTLWAAALANSFQVSHSQDARTVYWTKRHWLRLCNNEFTWPAVQKGSNHIHQQALRSGGPCMLLLRKNQERLFNNMIGKVPALVSPELTAADKPFDTDTLSCGTLPYTHCVTVPGTRVFVGCRRDDPERGRLWVMVKVQGTVRILHGFRGHQDLISSMIATDRQIITASLDSTIKVWNVSEEGPAMLTLHNEFRGHTGWVHALAVEKNILVSGGSDDSVRVWCLEKGKQVGSYRGFYEAFGFGILSVSIHRERIGIGSVFGPFYILDLDGKVLLQLEERLTHSYHLRYEQDLHQMHASSIRILSETIVTSSRLNDQLCVWDKYGQWLGTLNVDGNLHQVEVDASEQLMMATTCHGSVKLWDFTLKPRDSLQNHQPRRLLQGGGGGTRVGEGSVWVKHADQLNYMW